MSKYDVIKFIDDSLELDVNVSPDEETVWLTKEQIGLLFDRDRSVITKHINKIYKDNELNKKGTCAKNAQVQIEGSRKVKRNYLIYNLDVIISVGYRVNSKRGIIFRKWATKVLKDYLIKGYSISDRAIITKENYQNLTNKVIELDKEVKEIKKQIETIKPSSKIFYEGEYFDSYIFMKNIFEEAKTSIIIVDPYLDQSIFEYLKILKKNIKCSCIFSKSSKLSNKDFESFSKQYFDVKYSLDNTFHDRFIIIDNKTIYHVGTSLNYLGNKTFVVDKISDAIWTKDFLTKLNKQK